MTVKNFIGLAVLTFLVGCATQQPKSPEQKQQEEIQKKQEEAKQPVIEIPPGTRLAEASLVGKSGSNIQGTVTFEQLPNNVLVTYNIINLPPKQDFGFHIHEIGDCSSDDGKSAGGHFFPLTPTGGTSKENPGRFAGDLQMLHSDETGLAEGTYKTNKFTVAKNRAIVGRAVIIHAAEDDVTKPSSPRIACGQIAVKQPTVNDSAGDDEGH